jgi:hypothetical protein
VMCTVNTGEAARRDWAGPLDNAGQRWRPL